jgi:PAS domain-containing protein
MTVETIITLSILCLGALCTAFITLYALALLGERKSTATSITFDIEGNDIIFLFDGETLINATQSARNVLNATADIGSDWSKLLSALIHRFPSFQTEIDDLVERGNMDIESRDGSAVLRCEWRNGLARLSLLDMETAQSHIEMDYHSLAAMEQELKTLRATSEHVPFLVWRELNDGTVSWANSAYFKLADAQLPPGKIPSWPPISLFDTKQLFATTPGDFKRLALPNDTNADHPYEVFPMPTGDETLYTAIPADRTVRAEKALREFRQTLTKTFAHLTIGLAVFDRNRNLTLFNPALLNLTNLPVDFLSNRPALTTFLDRLRDMKMMPEPKNYKSWRQEISALEAAARVGTYEEIWSLHGGVTYRVSGRPHPDGAIAFLFEDISAEMSLTRRFRAEIETSQAVFDSLSEAIAVFANDGTLLMANNAYTSLWGSEGTKDVLGTGVLDATRIWHSKCAPTPIWADVRDFVSCMEKRSEWNNSVRLWDGRRLNCRFAPLSGGQTLAGFSPESTTFQMRAKSQHQADPRFVEM